MSLNTGFLLAQRYRLGRQIAVGGMGEVWEAEDTRLGRQVALKVLKPELTGDPEFRHRFHTEAQMTASLNHPGIAGIHDYGEAVTAPGNARQPYAEADTAYLVMELVAGDSLATILMRQPRLPADQTLDILGQAADALQAAHERGLVHRDVKPGNILITPAGRVKLTDFGIAKAVDAAPVTRQGMVMGTAQYIAPEQAAGDDAGPASDIYSLGVVGYECLAGARPFQSDNPLTVAMKHVNEPPPPLPPDVPPPVRALIESALVKDPRQRYRTGGEFGAAVAAVRSGRRPGPPGGADTAATTALTGQHNRQTALLLPGTRYEQPPATAYEPPTDPPRTGRAGDAYPEEPPGRRRTSPRVAIVVALVGVLALVLGAYAVREALRGTGTGSGSGATVAAPGPSQQQEQQQPGAPVTAEQPPPQQQQAPDPPRQQEQTQAPEPAPEQTTTTEDKPEDVFVVPTDYVGKSGSSAAATAEEKGLSPKVVDKDGNEVDSDQQSDCQVTEIDPAAGFVSPGSNLELTCEGS